VVGNGLGNILVYDITKNRMMYAFKGQHQQKIVAIEKAKS